MRTKAIEMYLEGLGFCAIWRLLWISYGAVYQWIKHCGETLSMPKPEGNIRVVELDELHTYVGSKNYRWIWTAVDRLGKRFVAFVVGDRSAASGKVESYNSRIRHYLARFKRKTKCYSKSEHMIVVSLTLLFLKLSRFDCIF